MVQETEGGSELAVVTEVFSPTAVSVVLVESFVRMPSALTVPTSKPIWLTYPLIGMGTVVFAGTLA